MAAIDYGAIYKINGKFINRDSELFSETPDFVSEEALYPDGETYTVRDNYYIYVGDKECFLCFYKGTYIIVYNETVVLQEWNMPFISYTHLNPAPEIERLKVSHLDPELHLPYDEVEHESWEEHVRINWEGATGKEKPNELQGGLDCYKLFLKGAKRMARLKDNHYFWRRTQRWLAEWDYKGDHYEVIFGYGIDPSSELWKDERFRKSYGFTERELTIIDSWFEGKEGILNGQWMRRGNR